jgi:hypothetical protein
MDDLGGVFGAGSVEEVNFGLLRHLLKQFLSRSQNYAFLLSLPIAFS